MLFTYTVIVLGNAMSRIIAAGGVMIELSPAGNPLWRLGIGGDTFNTTVHCARLGAAVTAR